MLEKYIKLSYCNNLKISKNNRKILSDRNAFRSYIQNLKSKNIKEENIVDDQLQISKDGIKLINYHSKEYPYPFKNIPDPPLVFYAQGNLDLLNNLKVAIVGSRTPNMNNIYLAGELAKFLSDHNITVVSGFAKGIDTVAHQNSMNSTIAVLGTGFNRIYPKENLSLYNELKNTGLIISEYPLNTLPLKYNFPKRNRLIAALADIVIIIEAQERSGSLITARFALDYNKDIFSVPGHPLDNKVKGCNMLIKEGAYMLLDFEEVLEILYRKYPNLQNNVSQNNLHYTKRVKEEERDQSSNEDDILNLISDTGVPAEEIADKLNMDATDLNKSLSKLELSDMIYKDICGNIFRKYIN